MGTSAVNSSEVSAHPLHGRRGVPAWPSWPGSTPPGRCAAGAAGPPAPARSWRGGSGAGSHEPAPPTLPPTAAPTRTGAAAGRAAGRADGSGAPAGGSGAPAEAAGRRRSATAELSAGGRGAAARGRAGRRRARAVRRPGRWPGRLDADRRRGYRPRQAVGHRHRHRHGGGDGHGHGGGDGNGHRLRGGSREPRVRGEPLDDVGGPRGAVVAPGGGRTPSSPSVPPRRRRLPHVAALPPLHVGRPAGGSGQDHADLGIGRSPGGLEGPDGTQPGRRKGPPPAGSAVRPIPSRDPAPRAYRACMSVRERDVVRAGRHRRPARAGVGRGERPRGVPPLEP